MVNGLVDFNYPMRKLVAARVGGKVGALCHVKDMDELKGLVAFLSDQDIPYLAIGKGSNILVKDDGFRGVGIVLQGRLSEIQRLEDDKDTIRAGAGLALPKLLDYCRLKGLGGLEFLAGIPGTVGGAVAMNAGAFWREIGGLIREVQVVMPDGKTKVMSAAELKFSYRSSSLPRDAVIAMATMGLQADDPERVASRISENMRRRKETQPLEYPSCGSVFKNPSGDFAGRLIEEAGLKGKRVGGAEVSAKHGNFIVNIGGAMAGDFICLMEMVQRTVKERTGIELEPEIRIIG